MTKQLFTMHSIEAETGIAVDSGAPFCQIRTITSDGERRLRTAPPGHTLRELALNFLRTASDAEAEAALYTELVDFTGIPPEIASTLIATVRARRLS